MRPLLAALVGLCLLAVIGGDPRAGHDLSRSSAIALTGLALSVVVGAIAWGSGRRRSGWLLVVSVLLAVMGALSGWIAGAELTGQPDAAVQLARAPARAAFMIAMTTAGMALPAAGLAYLAGRARRRGTART